MFTTINNMEQEKLQSKAKRIVKLQNISLLMFSKNQTSSLFQCNSDTNVVKQLSLKHFIEQIYKQVVLNYHIISIPHNLHYYHLWQKWQQQHKNSIVHSDHISKLTKAFVQAHSASQTLQIDDRSSLYHIVEYLLKKGNTHN